nr:MAG: hypothetical protein 1 [Betanecrovirus sp.]
MENLLVFIVRAITSAIFLCSELLIFIITHSVAVTLAVVLLAGFVWCIRKIFVVRVTIHPAATETYQRMLLLFQFESMFSDETHHVSTNIGDKDADLLPDPQSENTKIVKSSRRVSYAVRVAHVAKAQVGLLANTKANELVYARLCRDEMIKHGVRPSHIAHSVPLAVAACFIPLDADFLAASIRNSSELRERVALLGRPSSA